MTGTGTGPLEGSSLTAARRSRELAALAAGESVDVLVVGLGATGAGVALDAASRGLSVAAIDAHASAFLRSEAVHSGSIPGRTGLPRNTDRGMPRGPQYEKVISNLSEVKARQGKILAIATRGDHEIGTVADDVIMVPDTALELQPILTVLPLQLLAYHVADLKGTDVDQPRNLAKSVTVE